MHEGLSCLLRYFGGDLGEDRRAFRSKVPVLPHLSASRIVARQVRTDAPPTTRAHYEQATLEDQSRPQHARAVIGGCGWPSLSCQSPPPCSLSRPTGDRRRLLSKRRGQPGRFLPTVENTNPPPAPAPDGMVWIPGGEFSMGARSGKCSTGSG